LHAQIAKNLGFYEKYKLDAELTVVNSGRPALPRCWAAVSTSSNRRRTRSSLTRSRATDLKVVVGNEVKNFFNLVVSNKVKLPPAGSPYSGRDPRPQGTAHRRQCAGCVHPPHDERLVGGFRPQARRP